MKTPTRPLASSAPDDLDQKHVVRDRAATDHVVISAMVPISKLETMMDVADFPLPPYGAKKLARHGAAIERLTKEREQGVGEFAHHSLVSALAFDAADYIWAALMVVSPVAQQTREVRNMLAEAMIETLEGWDDLPSELRNEQRA